MYESHFGFRERPFRPTPDTSCYYAATGHERALGRLLEALLEDEALVLLTGEPGTGKTLLCHCLLERLGPDAVAIFLTHSHIPTRLSLLQTILYDLSLPYEGRSEQELRLALTDHLLNNFSEGKRTILVMDEAQHLNAEVLEELRLLANLEGRHGRAFQVVLAAQAAFLDVLRRPDLAVLNQRLAVRTRLEPLALPEAADYLLHQIRTAGGRPDAIMTDEAVELIARGSRGLPRLLNQTAHEALRLACTSAVTVVDAESALEALAQLGLSEEPATVGPETTLLSLGDASPESEGTPTGDEEEAGCRIYSVPRQPA
jgi:type II secretory pathway predicted ATPase ExeA